MSPFYFFILLAVAVTLVFVFFLIRYGQERRAQMIRMLRLQHETELEMRQQLSGFLHEEMGKEVHFIRKTIASMQHKLGDIPESADVFELIDEAERLMQYADQIKNTIKSINDSLLPAGFHALSFEQLLRRMINQTTAGFNGRVIFRMDAGLDTLTDFYKFNLYSIVHLFVTNSILHSGASILEIILKSKDHQVVLHLSDNGRGFNLNQLLKNFDQRGVLDIQARIISLNPVKQVYKSDEHSGTTLDLTLNL